jgi:hypothetical protein
MSVFKDNLRREILDGKTTWTPTERTAEAYDLFDVQIVQPLRELHAEGLFDEMKEIPKPLLGKPLIGQVIIFGVNPP